MNISTLLNAIFYTDSYKPSHFVMAPPNTEFMYSHLTPRNNRYFKQKYPNHDGNVVVYGVQYALTKLNHDWNVGFFYRSWEEVETELQEFLTPHIGTTDFSRFQALHTLGYLPIEVRSAEEGTLIPVGCPVLTIHNTVKEFYWLANYLETTLLSLIYKPMTAATLSRELAQLREYYCNLTGVDSITKGFMLHDFSGRGHPSPEAAGVVGSAFTLFSNGTDTIPALVAAKKYYDAKTVTAFSIPASEHSVTTLAIQYYSKLLEQYLTGVNTDVDEVVELTGFSKETIEEILPPALNVYYQSNNLLLAAECFNLGHLLLDVYPTGVMAYVTDSYDFWGMINYSLPALKKLITKRDGKLVIRPDSSDPTLLLLGEVQFEYINDSIDPNDVSKVIACGISERYQQSINQGTQTSPEYKGVVRYRNEYYQVEASLYLIGNMVDEVDIKSITKVVLSNQDLGLFNSLDNIFGHTINDKGFKVLDTHIGVVYGDGMTYQRINDIYQGMVNYGYCVSNVVLAAGAFMLNSITRDDLGMSLKCSYAEVKGTPVNVYKEPKTDPGKNSTKGLLCLERDEDGVLTLTQETTPNHSMTGLLQPVYNNGKFIKRVSYEDLIEKVKETYEVSV